VSAVGKVKIISIISSLEVRAEAIQAEPRPFTALFQTFLTGFHNVKVYQTCSADSLRYATGLEFGQIDTILARALLVVAVVQRIRALK